MIALYRGVSLISRLIRFFTWGPYSHAALVHPGTGQVIEAWLRGGVRCVGSISEQHTPGTPVDLYDVLCPAAVTDAAWDFARGTVGARYDFRGILNFISRRAATARSQARWFCSELAVAAYAHNGLNLLERVPAWKISPSLLSYSPALRFRETVYTGSKRSQSPFNASQARPTPRYGFGVLPPTATTATPIATISVNGPQPCEVYL